MPETVMKTLHSLILRSSPSHLAFKYGKVEEGQWYHSHTHTHTHTHTRKESSPTLLRYKVHKHILITITIVTIIVKVVMTHEKARKAHEPI